MSEKPDLIRETVEKMLDRYPAFGAQAASCRIEYRDDLRFHTAATDGKNIFLDPDFFEGLSEEERLFVIAHEIMHMKFLHMFRLKGKDGQMRDPNLWNIATDAIINANLERDGFTIKEGYVNMPEAKNYSAEEFYDVLLKEKEKQEQEKKENEKKGSKSEPGEGEPSEGNPGEGNPGEGNPGEGNPGEEKSGEGKPGEEKPGEEKPGEEKSGEGNPGEGNPGEGNPGEEKPGEGNPGEEKSGEGEPGEEKPGGGKSGDGKPGEGKPGEGKPGDGSPGGGKIGEEDPGEGTPSKIKFPESGGDHSMWEEAFKNQENPEQGQEDVDEKKAMDEKRKKNRERFLKNRQKAEGEKGDGKGKTSSVGEVGTSAESIDWKRFVKHKVEETKEVWMQGGRHYTPDNPYAYRLEEVEAEEEALTEVMIDVSGSVDLPLVKAFLRQLKPLVKETKLRVGLFNAEFWGFTEIKTERDIDNFEIPDEARGYSCRTEDWDLAVRSFSKPRDGVRVNKFVFTDGIPGPGHFPEDDLRGEDVTWFVYDSYYGPRFHPCCGQVVQLSANQIRQQSNLIKEKGRDEK